MRLAVSLLPFAILASSVIAGDIDANDVPSQCQDVCAPVVSLTSMCDKKTRDDDTDEINCVCKDPRAAKNLPICDACITKYSKDGSDNDANDLVRSCSLTTTTFDASTTSMGNSSSSASVTVATASGSVMSTGSAGSSATAGSATSSSATPTSGSEGNYAKLQNSFFGIVVAGFLATI